MTYDDFKELIKEQQRDEGANLSVKYVEYVYDKLSPAYQKRVLFSAMECIDGFEDEAHDILFDMYKCVEEHDDWGAHIKAMTLKNSLAFNAFYDITKEYEDEAPRL